MASACTDAPPRGAGHGGAALVPELGLVRIFSHAAAAWCELCAAAAVDSAWCAAASAIELRALRQRLCRQLVLPFHTQEELPPDALLAKAVHCGGVDWPYFCARQKKLQLALAGHYAGTLTPENLFRGADSCDFDWERQHYVFADFEPMDVEGNCCGCVVQHVYVDDELIDAWSGTFGWVALDHRQGLDRLIASSFAPRCEAERGHARSRASQARKQPAGQAAPRVAAVHAQPERPEEVWEDGDCLCGVRGTFDYRPVVDPEFIDLSPFSVLLVPRRGGPCSFWKPCLYAPCAWMFPKIDLKRPHRATILDHWASFRDERTVAALTLGRQLERAATFTTLDAMLACARTGEGCDAIGEVGEKASPDANTSRKTRRAARSERRGGGDPRNLCSGRNPKGLNYYIPRRRESRLGTSSGSTAARRAPPRHSVLQCGVAAQHLEAFLADHRPSLREAERLWVGKDPTGAAPSDYICPGGLIEEAQRLEASRILSQDSVVALAKKWRCLAGKWLLFVPEWRVDDLFASVARRLREGSMACCTDVIVSPPGSYGTDPHRFMLSAHCPDFTDRHHTVATGKSLRAAAREGLRAPVGTWGELCDDPFAAPGKKVSLVFKPEIFSHLGIHRNNPYHIKTSLYVLDL